MSESEQEPVPARMLNELVYCPRLFWLEHVAGEWDDNAETLNGKRIHRRVDAAPSDLPSPESLSADFARARSVSVGSMREQIVAKVDLVEVDQGIVYPVEYKRGAAPETASPTEDAVWPADRIQVGAQALALRDQGYIVHEAVIYYAQNKRRVTIAIDDRLVQDVRATVERAIELRRSLTPPAPLVSSPKCPRCSLVGICLPDEISALKLDETQPGTSSSESDEPQPPKSRSVRQLLARNDDRLPLYVQSNGAVVNRDGECLQIRTKEGTTSTARLAEISQLNIFGNVSVTTPALHELCRRGIDVGLFGYGGYYLGTVGGFSEQNVHLRITQFAVAADEEKRAQIAREFVVGKILNCRTLLRRNHQKRSELDGVLARLKQLSVQATTAKDCESLLGIEGSAARIYFEQFALMLSPRTQPESATFQFESRNRRPPKDPVNALLSFGYALLTKDARVALRGVGFDPTVGFYHRPRAGRPALALDLMEEFRPLIVDSVVLSVINTEEIQPDQFVYAAGSCALNEAGRRAFLSAYERRLDTSVTHPLFGYRATYHRILEIQARLLARTIQGELTRYPSFQTR